MKRYLVPGLLLVLAGSNAWAQTVPIKESNLSLTLTTSQANCVPPDSSIKTLSIQNLGAGNVGYCYRTASTPSTACTPSIGTKGTYTISSGALFFWPIGSAPENGLDCIAAGSYDVTVSIGR